MATINRKLASIRRIKQLLPIPGADMIETAVVDGWAVVVKKGENAVGDLICYFEIDSFIPTTIAPFLTKEGYEPKEYNGVKGERLKTIKLRKQLSQGLIVPLDALPQIDRVTRGNVAEGDDVTDILGIQKWEAPEEKANSNGQMPSKTRSFPYFIKKTDQERVQNYGHMLTDAVLDGRFEVTVKKDGSSMTVFVVTPGSQYYADAKAMVHGSDSLWTKIKNFVLRKQPEPVYGICSRNCLLPLEGNSNFHTAAKPVLAALEKYTKSVFFDGSVAIQGEVVAPDIQGNFEKVNGVEFHPFDIFEIDKQSYMLPMDRVFFADDFNVGHVTVVDRGTLRSILQLKDGEDQVQKALTYAEGEGDNPGVMREGVVFKSYDRDFSFKAISNSYLLKKG